MGHLYPNLAIKLIIYVISTLLFQLIFQVNCTAYYCTRNATNWCQLMFFKKLIVLMGHFYPHLAQILVCLVLRFCTKVLPGIVKPIRTLVMHWVVWVVLFLESSRNIWRIQYQTLRKSWWEWCLGCTVRMPLIFFSLLGYFRSCKLLWVSFEPSSLNLLFTVSVSALRIFHKFSYL